MNSSARCAISHFSFKMITAKSIQSDQKEYFTHRFDVLLVDQYTAEKEIARNTISKIPHHHGCVSSKIAALEYATNKNGVAKQCIKHKVLAVAPIMSDFEVKLIMFIKYKTLKKDCYWISLCVKNVFFFPNAKVIYFFKCN